MQEPTYLILTALVTEPLHGYAILTEVEKLAAGQVRMRVGTLYAALDRLAREGLVEVESEEIVNGRLRRYYRITAQGADALTQEAQRLARLARQARRRLAHRPIQAMILGFASDGGDA
jgi:PadR family transcriptional regulator, regulatory protein PadR